MTMLTQAVALTARQLRDDAEVLDTLTGAVGESETAALTRYARQCRRAARDLGRAAYAMDACEGRRPAIRASSSASRHSFPDQETATPETPSSCCARRPTAPTGRACR